MWDSHYLMGNFTLISWTDQSVCLISQTAGFSPHGYIVPASFRLGSTDMLHFLFYSHKFPLGINSVARGFEYPVLIRPITVWQPLVRVHKRNLYCNKCVMKMYKKYKKHSHSLNRFWLTMLDKMRHGQKCFLNKVFSDSTLISLIKKNDSNMRFKYIWFFWSFLSWYEIVI